MQIMANFKLRCRVNVQSSEIHALASGLSEDGFVSGDLKSTVRLWSLKK